MPIPKLADSSLVCLSRADSSAIRGRCATLIAAVTRCLPLSAAHATSVARSKLRLWPSKLQRPRPRTDDTLAFCRSALSPSDGRPPIFSLLTMRLPGLFTRASLSSCEQAFLRGPYKAISLILPGRRRLMSQSAPNSDFGCCKPALQQQHCHLDHYLPSTFK